MEFKKLLLNIMEFMMKNKKKVSGIFRANFKNHTKYYEKIFESRVAKGFFVNFSQILK